MSAGAPESLGFRDLDAVAADIRARTVSVREVVDACLAQAERFADYNALTVVTTEHARALAAELDTELDRGRVRGPLHGVPIVVKDLVDVAGYPNSAATSMLIDSAPAAANAPTVQALIDAGAVVVGLANLHEWAWGGTSSISAFGPVRNLWDFDRISGGSSGGTAVAVSGGMAFAGIGTDTGGSVRIPASYTGTSSIKVTAGTIPTDGVWPLAWTLDSVGLMARKVADLRAPYAAWSRYFGLHGEGAGRRATQLSDLVIGVDRDYYAGQLQAGVRERFDDALASLESAGARVVDVSIPLLSGASGAMYAVLLAEGSAVHSGAWMEKRKEYSPEVQALLAMGDTLSAQDYIAGLRYRPKLYRQFAEVFEQVDFLAAPTTSFVAQPIGQATVDFPGGDTRPLMDTGMKHCFPSNLVGIPSLAQPCGLTAEGLPVSFQLIGPPHSEDRLIRTGTQIEDAFSWYQHPPAVR